MADTLNAGTRVDDNGQEIAIPQMHHFGTATTRHDEMVSWYRNVVGLEVTLRSIDPMPKMTFVSSDLAHHRGGFFSPPFLEDHPEKPKHARIQHLAWEYASVEELLRSWRRIRECGIEPVLCVCHGVSFAFYYKDPDDNTVELLADAYGDHAKSYEHMTTNDDMITNPMGGYVDPAKLIEASEAGASIDELRERSLAGEYEPENVNKDPMLTW
jgi:catechol-2,3-dioxygenase